MLTQLYIDNVAVIEHAEVTLGAGLTVLTGETGAGKSILIDALSAVLGERVNRSSVRAGCEAATVTAVFDQLPATVTAVLDELGYSAEEDGTLWLRRRISAENKSLCFIGSEPCTAATMRRLGRLLVNIHGQHENQALLAVERHVEYLDRLGNIGEVHAAYEVCYRRYCDIHRQLRKLCVDEDDKARRLEMLRFQTAEIDEAALTVGEEEELAALRERLRHADKLRRLLQLASQTLDGDDDTLGAVSALEQCAATVKEAGRLMPEADELSSRLLNVLPELQDIAASVATLADAPDCDPAQLDAVEERLALIKRLCDKYGGSAEAVLSFSARAHEELQSIEHADEAIAALSAQLEAEKEALIAAATALTEARRRAAKVFAEAVGAQLSFLDMPRVRLDVSIEPASMTASGADKVEFLLSANPGEPPRPLAKIASGGELSRIMLALKSVMASADDIPTLIFDEIDSGISGNAAAKVGYKLRHIAALEGKQVLCVTHLAQIAACAHRQLLIKKQVADERTFTQVCPLEGEARVEELARIIGGQPTPSSKQTAQEMLDRLPSMADEAFV